MSEPMRYTLSHLAELEAESIHIIREVVAEFERPVLLYSVGKDSSVLLRLAQKAFFPAPLPFPLLHIDTGYKFPEMYAFRDRTAAAIGAELIVHRNEAAISDGANPYDLGTQRCCGALKTEALLAALSSGEFDAAFGGARRDEEKSRAKERVISLRSASGGWDPRQQRPELWNLYNCHHGPGESFRVFPLSSWTELDVWRYIEREEIEVAPLYFAKPRRVVERASQLIPVAHGVRLLEHEEPEEVPCRFRTLGCAPCTGAVRSEATTISDIIAELAAASLSERSTRVIDHDSRESMETKKREGYF